MIIERTSESSRIEQKASDKDSPQQKNQNDIHKILHGLSRRDERISDDPVVPMTAGWYERATDIPSPTSLGLSPTESTKFATNEIAKGIETYGTIAGLSLAGFILFSVAFLCWLRKHPKFCSGVSSQATSA